MEAAQQRDSGNPSPRESGLIGNIVRNVRGWLRLTTEQDRAYMDHRFSEYLEIVDAHGAGSENAQAFRDGLKALPYPVRTEILRLCGLLDKRRNQQLSAGE